MAPTIPIGSSGVWGSPTSTLDWCEKNYQVRRFIRIWSFLAIIVNVDNFRAMITNCSFFLQVTIYIAEFWNTITNLSMIVPALYGLSNVLKQGLERRWVPDMNTNIK